MNIPLTQRSIRASWQQLAAYAVGIAIAVSPFAQEHDWSDLAKMEHFFEFLRIVGGALIMIAARSPIERKAWSTQDRIDKITGENTPPSK